MKLFASIFFVIFWASLSSAISAGAFRLHSDSYKFSGIAVKGDTAYLAKDHRGVWLVDVKTGKKKEKTIEFLPNGERLNAESVQVAGNELIVAGITDGGIAEFRGGPFIRNYTIYFYDLSKKEIPMVQQLDLDLVEYAYSDSAIVQIPSLSFQYEKSENKIYIGFNQKRRSVLVKFSRPQGNKKWKFGEISSARYYDLGSRLLKAFTVDDGIALLTASPAGSLYNVDTRSRSASIIDFGEENLGDPVSLQVYEGHILVVDHSFAVHVLEKSTGRLLRSWSVPGNDWLSGAAQSNGWLFISSRHGYIAEKIEGGIL